ncbi:MAG: cbb3-type cytochrome c oxidase subunit I [Anaerolineales bacterium]
MPRLSRIAVRLSQVYLVVGSTFGALMLANKGIPFAPTLWALLPSHVDVMFLGWMTQFALGIAFWILPRIAGSAPRGNEYWSRAGFALLNVGICISVLAPAWPTQHVLMIARGFELTGVILFSIGNWLRIYPLKFQIGK